MSRLLKQVVAQVSRTVPLQTVLIVPFVLQTLLTVGLVGYFSFKNRQEAINDLTSQLRRELTNRIEGKLQTYTEIPHNINRLNASTFAQGKIDASAVKGEFPLWQQIQIYPMVSDIYCGDRHGSLLGVRRSPADGSIELRSSNVATGHKLYGYSLDRNGQRDQLVSQGNKPFDPRVRPWYKAAVTAGEPIWSGIYADFASQLPTITASTPVYSTADRSLLGVCATDVFLPSEMSRFLASLQIGKTGSAFILERSGQLVATSTAEAIMSSGTDSTQLQAIESHNPTVRATAAYLRDHFGNLQQIQSAEQLDFNLNGERQLVQVMPFHDIRGLDWLIVTVLPESDFMAQIRQGIQTTILLCVAALLLGIIISILTARWITEPIVNVSQLAKALTRGEWNQTLEVERSGDLGELARSFNQMAHQITNYNQTLQQQVAERTNELAQEKQLLQAIIDHIPVMITLYDVDGQIQFVNREFEQCLGWSTAELKNIDLAVESFPDLEQRQTVLDHMLAATGRWMDIKSRTKDDRYIDTSWANIRLLDGMGVGIGQDISERRNAALRERKRAEAASILEERNRMAREIHDTLAQSFTGILLHIGAAVELLTKKPEAAQAHLETADELARTGLAEARRSVAALRPKLLEEGDLFSALKHLTAQMQSSTDTHITCEIIGTAHALSPDVENHLLRIGQEALTNTLKHAHATEIHVELVCEETLCLLRVKDNGQGFAVEQLSSSRGFGLLGMSERAEQMGGELMIKSQPGQGTEVVVIVNRE
ncbi:MAG TPA: histidine kinase [Coleofasciculaceae cyanobacterium]